MTIRATPRFAGRSHLAASQPVPGPIAEADLSQGYFARAWMLWVDGFGNPHQSILPNANPNIDIAPSYLGDVNWIGVRRPTIVADQNGRRVVAWQDQGGGVTVSYIETGTPEIERRVSVADGFDPVLVWDGWMLDPSGQTDIILFYLASDHETVQYRLQSELYAVTHTYLSLTEPATLDGFKIVGLELCLGGQYELSGTQWESRTTLYPTYIGDRSKITIRNKGGSASEITVLRDPDSGAVAMRSRNSKGLFAPIVVIPDPNVEAIKLLSRNSLGSYRLLGQEFDAINSPLYQIARNSKGVYFLVFVSSGDNPQEFTNLRARNARGLLDERVVQRDNATEAVAVSSRNARGSFLEVGRFFDPTSESFFTFSRHSSGAFVQRVFYNRDDAAEASVIRGRNTRGTVFEAYKQRDDTTDNATIRARNSRGVFGESERVTYQTEALTTVARNTSGSLVQQNLAPARDALNDNAIVNARNSRGAYLPGATYWWATTPQMPFIDANSDGEWMYVWGEWQ